VLALSTIKNVRVKTIESRTTKRVATAKNNTEKQKHKKKEKEHYYLDIECEDGDAIWFGFDQGGDTSRTRALECYSAVHRFLKQYDADIKLLAQQRASRDAAMHQSSSHLAESRILASAQHNHNIMTQPAAQAHHSTAVAGKTIRGGNRKGGNNVDAAPRAPRHKKQLTTVQIQQQNLQRFLEAKRQHMIQQQILERQRKAAIAQARQREKLQVQRQSSRKQELRQQRVSAVNGQQLADPSLFVRDRQSIDNRYHNIVPGM
jgi:hypothetical protein